MEQPHLIHRRSFSLLSLLFLAAACAPAVTTAPAAAATPAPAPTGSPAPDPMEAIRKFSVPAQTEPAFVFRART